MKFQMILPILSICYFFSLFGKDISAHQNELMAIDKKIQSLNEQLRDKRLMEIKQEVEGQEFMIADWKAYGQNVLQIRKQEEEEKSLEQEIQRLKQRQADLLFQQAH